MDIQSLFTRRLLVWAVVLSVLFTIGDVPSNTPRLLGKLTAQTMMFALLLAAGKGARRKLDRRLGFA